MKNYLNLTLVIIAISLLIGCNDDSAVTISPQDKVTFYQLSADDDLSVENLQKSVNQNPNIEIILTENLSLKFIDIQQPVILDAEADMVYSTKDGRGHITFGSDGTMYFMIDELEKTTNSPESENPWVRTYWGRINNNPTIISQIKADSENINRSQADLSNNIEVNNTGKNIFVEYTRHEVKTGEIFDNTMECNLEHDCVDEVPENSLVSGQAKLSKSSTPNAVKIKVYTYKKALSNDLINRAKIVALSCHSHGFDRSVTKIYTYFGTAENGNKKVNFNADLSDEYDLNPKWKKYVTDNKLYGWGKSHYKFLLLTDFSLNGVRGRANQATEKSTTARFGWANVDVRSGFIPSHEIGHMLSAHHTGSYWMPTWWIFGWWCGDVMYNDGKWDFLKHRKTHLPVNRNRIKAHVGFLLSQ